MRKTIFIFFVLLGAGAGLLASLNGDIGNLCMSNPACIEFQFLATVSATWPHASNAGNSVGRR